MEPSSGFEPETPSLPWKCSTPELRRRIYVNDRCILTDYICFEESFMVTDRLGRIQCRAYVLDRPRLVSQTIKGVPLFHKTWV